MTEPKHEGGEQKVDAVASSPEEQHELELRQRAERIADRARELFSVMRIGKKLVDGVAAMDATDDDWVEVPDQKPYDREAIIQEILVDLRAKESIEYHHESIAGMAIAYKRTKADNGKNIVGWSNALDENALHTLESTKIMIERGEQLSEIDIYARDTAAIIDIIHESERGGEIDSRLLEATGVNMEWLLDYLKTGLRAVYQKDDYMLERINSLTSITDMEEVCQSGAEREILANPRLEELTQMLESSGIELPQLGEDGLYDNERI
jgi:hypothetical protein